MKSQGHEAYIVGGAVRDLLLGREPKDFDIATDATPNRVRRLFRNSRIIGKRFRLTHIYFHEGKIHEVATFRAQESGDSHVYGTLVEDVMRRDFTLNALYFDPEEETVIDFVGGVKDLQKKLVNSVLPLDTSFTEDPVRMLRAVKYAAIGGLRVSRPVGMRIKKQAALLATASTSRLSEELYKILKSQNAEVIFRLMDKYKLILPILPNYAKAFQDAGSGKALKESFFLSLAKLDQKMSEEELSRGGMIRYMAEDILTAAGVFDEKDGMAPLLYDAVQELKRLLRPMVQPNRAIEEAVRLMFTERGLKIPRKRPRHSETRGGTEGEKRHRRYRRGRRKQP